MTSSTRRLVASLAVVAVVGLVVVRLIPTPTSRGRDSAESYVQLYLDDPDFHGYADEVLVWAERLEAAVEGTGMVMVDVEELDTEVHWGQPIGRVTLAVTVADSTGSDRFFDAAKPQDPGPHCIEVTFQHWGVLGTRQVRCPADGVVAVPVPASKRPHIARNAEEAVWSVLSDLPAGPPPSQEEVADAVTELLEPHTNGVTPLAEVTVAVEDGVIAVATGDDDDCVLVARGADGQVRDVSVPSIYLKEGELGCRARTAFADLRPPH